MNELVLSNEHSNLITLCTSADTTLRTMHGSDSFADAQFWEDSRENQVKYK